MFDKTEDKEIKNIFKHLTGWEYTKKNNSGIIYWEVNFKDDIDPSIDQEMLFSKIYNLYFEPAVSIGKRATANFYGLYNDIKIREDLKLAEFK